MSFHKFQMSPKVLSSWKIAKSQPFFPISIQCIGYEAEYALLIYSMHTVNTFIFRNFIDAIENDKPAQKCYLHASFEPHTIHDVTVGINESVILLTNGQLKFFKTPKQLVNVENLASVKTICGTNDGLVLIKSSSNGTNFFVEILPYTFLRNVEPIESKIYDISFDSGSSYCQSTWHHSQFKIKELNFPGPASNKFLMRLFREEVPMNECNDKILFFAIDNNLFSLHVDPVEHFVVPIVTCSANIIDFWTAKNGNWISLLLSSGAMMLMYLSKDEYEIQHEYVYFGAEVTAFALTNDLFIYSNELLVEWMDIELNEENANFEFHRNSANLPGIAALTVLAEFSIAVAVSENCQFYAISLPPKRHTAVPKSSMNAAKKWLAVDQNMVKQLKQLKFDLIELTDAYDNLLSAQLIYQHMFDAIKLKRADIRDSDNETNKNTRFVASCLATKTPPILSASEESQTINIVNSSAYDRNTSFFVQIEIVAVIYANEFNTNIWNLRCRWLNDMCENEYANVKLTTESLLQPLKFIVHLRQQYLPEFELDVNTIVRIGNSYLCVSFPVHTTQPNYCELLQVMPSPSLHSSLPTATELQCAIKLPQGITLNDLFHGKLLGTSKTTKKTQFEIRLLGKRLILTHQTDDAQSIELRCADAGLMYYTKIYLYDLIRRKLPCANQISRVSANAMKEYSVSSFSNYCPIARRFIRRSVSFIRL